MAAKMVCCSRHHLRLTGDKHHIVPKAWGGPDAGTNLKLICPNYHRLTHTLLNEYKRTNGNPDGSYRRSFPRFVQGLAERGWEGTVAMHTTTVLATNTSYRKFDLTGLPDL